MERGIFAVGKPLRMEGIDGVREEGKEDKDACRVRLLFALVAVPFVVGRYERTDDMALREKFFVSQGCRTKYSSKRAIIQASFECLYPPISFGIEHFIAFRSRSR